LTRIIRTCKQTPGQAASAARKRQRQAEKKAALEEEAKKRGLSVSQLVQEQALATKEMIEEREAEKLRERQREKRHRKYYSVWY